MGEFTELDVLQGALSIKECFQRAKMDVDQTNPEASIEKFAKSLFWSKLSFCLVRLECLTDVYNASKF